MENEKVLLRVPTKKARHFIELSVLFSSGNNYSWTGDLIEIGYHFHVNAIVLDDEDKQIKAFTGLREFISHAEEFNEKDIDTLKISNSFMLNMALDVARRNQLKIAELGLKMIRDYPSSPKTH